jgi:protein-S-isoprenylcysteine O-methyltransferase Ste14
VTATGVYAANTPITALNHIRAVLLLPFMNTVIVPATLLIVFSDARFALPRSMSDVLLIGASLLTMGLGLMLVIRAISLFVHMGRGTLAPWDPAQVLITGDIYRYSRNPMKAGLFLVLLGELMLLRSPALGLWALSFMVANTLYIRWFEEPGLRARFGKQYETYCRRVPRWLRLLPEKRA